MECLNSYGKPKIKYETHELAVEAAKKCNLQPKRIHKLVTYKCSKCFKYHIGSNGKILKKESNIYLQTWNYKNQKTKTTVLQ